MKQIYKLIVFFSLGLILSSKLCAQQENTLYFMDRIPQSNYLNPAQHPDCKFWIGGLLVPVMGQTGSVIPFTITPALPMHFDFFTPLSFNDVIYKGTGALADSLVTFANSVEDQKKFLSKLNDVNTINSNLQLDFLTFGFKQGKNYWTFDLSEKMAYSFTFSKAMFEFPLRGNIDYDTRLTNFSGLGMDLKWYRELSIGFLRKTSPVFVFGAHVKLLQGIVGYQTENSKLQFTNADNDLYWKLSADYKVNNNLPVDSVTYSKDGSRIDNIKFKKASEFAKMLTSFDNKGIALDLGFSHTWNTELSIYGSMIDLGFIDWRGNANSFQIKGDTLYQGFKVNSLSTSSLVSSPNIDTLLRSFPTSYEKGGYRTWLNPKFYFGGNYKFTKKIAVGLLGRFEKTPFDWSNSYTASLNLKPFKWGAISCSYSIIRNTYVNLGFGSTLRIGPCQWFCVYDINPLLIDKSQYISFRWGGNLVFGRNVKTRKQIKDMPLLLTF